MKLTVSGSGNTNIGEGIPSLRMDTNIITLNWGARVARRNKK